MKMMCVQLLSKAYKQILIQFDGDAYLVAPEIF